MVFKRDEGWQWKHKGKAVLCSLRAEDAIHLDQVDAPLLTQPGNAVVVRHRCRMEREGSGRGVVGSPAAVDKAGLPAAVPALA